MSMIDWAEREVAIACKRERKGNGTPEGEWDYGCACYESALKAYKSLMDDGHSGYSWNVTKHILMRLMDGRPLTPFEDTEDIWSDCYRCEDDDYTAYQCKRMSSLFKYVYDDGSVKYHDVDRYYCVDVDNPDDTYTSGLPGRIIDEMFPITMPYFPPSGKYKVVCEDILFDPKNGDFDAKAILYVVEPNGNRIDINRYFDCRGEGWKEIDYDTWYELKLMSNSWKEAED